MLITKIVIEVQTDNPPKGPDLLWSDDRIHAEFRDSVNAITARINNMFPPSWQVKATGKELAYRIEDNYRT